MTFNIRQGRGIDGGRGIDLDPIVDVLRAEATDVVGLQEVHDRGWERGSFAQASVLAASAGYPYVRYAHAATRGGRSHGNALLSRFPIVWSRTVELDPGARRREGRYVERRVALQALLNVPDGAGAIRQVMVLVTHLGHDPIGQERAVARLVEHVNGSEHPTVLLGDLNLSPESERLAPLFEASEDVALTLGTAEPTYPARAPKARIDYILSAGTTPAVGAQVVETLASDHRPVSARLLIT